MLTQIKQDVLRKFAALMVDDKGDPVICQQRQTKLLRAVVEMSSASFASYFTDFVVEVTGNSDIYQPDEQLPSLHSKYNASKVVVQEGYGPLFFHKPTPASCLDLYHAWKHELSAQEAALEGVWCAITVQELRVGNIHAPWWLLAQGQDQTTVGKAVSKAVDSGSGERLIRLLIRNMAAGASEYRGQPALYTNCSLAKAYWIGKISASIAYSEQEAARVLAAHWYRFSDMVFSKKSSAIPELKANALVQETKQESEDDHASLPAPADELILLQGVEEMFSYFETVP